MTPTRSSPVAILSCFLSWEMSLMRSLPPTWLFIFGTRLSYPWSIVFNCRLFLGNFFKKRKTAESRFLSVHFLQYQPPFQKKWQAFSCISCHSRFRLEIFKTNTTVLEVLHLDVIIKTGCTRRWSLLIELHSKNFVALGSCSPLVHQMPISIAQIFLFSHLMVNGCKRTMQTRLKAGSKCFHFNPLPILTVVSQHLCRYWYRQSTRRSCGGHLWLPLLFPFKTASYARESAPEIFVLFYHAGFRCAWTPTFHPRKCIFRVQCSFID